MKKLRRRSQGTVVSVFLAALFLIVCLVILEASHMRVLAVDTYEDVAYFMSSTPERAFTFGTRHFSVDDPADYDINRAKRFYMLAASKDPSMLNVYHQLARISFLQSDFKTALTQIDFQIDMHGETTPPSYYVRGLIEGYTGDYVDAEVDYAHFLRLEPENWAGLNDYAWVLLKDNKPAMAAAATASGLALYPDNPWLLNSSATALYEIGDVTGARVMVERAKAAVQTLTPAQWSIAYPGNDPAIAQEGVDTFKKAVDDNMRMIIGTTSVQTAS